MWYSLEEWSSGTHGNDVMQIRVSSLGLILGFRDNVRINTRVRVRVRVNVKA